MWMSTRMFSPPAVTHHDLLCLVSGRDRMVSGTGFGHETHYGGVVCKPTDHVIGCMTEQSWVNHVNRGGLAHSPVGYLC